MKRLKYVLILVALAVVALPFALGRAKSNAEAYSAANNKLSPEQELIALDRKWTAAELRLNDDDRRTISSIVADDFTGITPFGQIQNKTQYMAGLKSSTDTDVADEYVVHFFDNGRMAIMTHRGNVNGKPTYRSTHVWVKKGNMWQLIQNHVSNIGEPPTQ